MDPWICPACERENVRAQCQCGKTLLDAYHAERARSSAARTLIRSLETRLAEKAPPPDDTHERAAEAVLRALDAADAPRDTPHMGDGWWDEAARRIAGLAHKRDVAQSQADRLRAQIADLIVKIDNTR